MLTVPDGHADPHLLLVAATPQIADLGAKDKTTMPALSAAGSQIGARDDRSPSAHHPRTWHPVNLNPAGTSGRGLAAARIARPSQLTCAAQSQRTAPDTEQVLLAAERILVSSRPDRELAGQLLVAREL